MQENRRKRPPVERTDPRRIWPATDAPPRDDSASEGDAPTSRGAREPPGAREASYQAINDAYRLIDEYVRQGQKMAENLWLPTEDPGGEAEGGFKAPLRFMRAMGDMTMAWVDVMQRWTNDAVSPSGVAVGPFTAGRTPPEQPRAESSNGATRAPALRVSVKSRGVVEVSVHLGEGTQLGELSPGELRPFSGDAAPIKGVTLEAGSAGEGPLLRVVVPDDQPPGTYNGLLVDLSTQRPRGTVSLSISCGEGERGA
jgi:hypothetical protein